MVRTTRRYFVAIRGFCGPGGVDSTGALSYLEYSSSSGLDKLACLREGGRGVTVSKQIVRNKETNWSNRDSAEVPM